MKLVESVHVEGFLYDYGEEFGFRIENQRRDGSIYYTVEPLIINELYEQMSDYAISLDKAVQSEDEYEDVTYEFENVGIQLYFTESQTTLDQAQEYLVLDVLGGLTGSEGWFGYSEYTILGYCVSDFTVGGHDIMEVLQQHEGEYCHIVFNIYE